jgi:hypothetical protein
MYDMLSVFPFQYIHMIDFVNFLAFVPFLNLLPRALAVLYVFAYNLLQYTN